MHLQKLGWRQEERRAFGEFSDVWERYRTEWGPRIPLFAGATEADKETRQQLREQHLGPMAEADWTGLSTALDRVLSGAPPPWP